MQQKKNIISIINSTANSCAAHTITTFMKHISMLALLLMTFALGARAQNYYYVFKNGNGYYISNNNGNVAATQTFSPSCVWIASNALGNTSRSLQSYVDNTKYLRGTTNSLSIGNSQSYWRTNNNFLRYRKSSSNQRYIGYNNNQFTFNTSTNANRDFVAYQVTFTPVSTTSTNPTINGNDVLTATGNYPYTASGAAYQAGGYTNYRFDVTDHCLLDNNNTAITPEAATLSGTTWSLTANDYATINSSGAVTVKSIPTSDVTLTITATVAVTGGKPAAPAGTTLVGTKEITIQGSAPAAPTISVNGTTVTMQTDAAGTTSIRYTLDGTVPTATSGTIYNGAFDISNSKSSPVTIKAITVRNGNTSSVTTQQVKLTLPEPVITVNAETGKATITCSNSSATIYYTTDGSTPSATNGTQYNGQITGLATMATVKAIAVCDGWNSSSVTSATVTIPSGVSGGTVTLFDYEDHNWTYYSGVDEGNYNTKYAGKLYSPNPRNVKITYNGVNRISGSSTKVRVSIDESETTFVYYKTLEESTSDNYPYQVISNPFSVRPSTGSGGSKVYYGFAGWKIVSGHQYIKRANGTMAAEGATLSLDEEITFVGLPYPSVNCISAEIVFETTWKIANRTYVSSNPGSNQTYNTNGDYESNFYVINCGYTRTITASKPVTIMMVEPDGSADYRTNNTFTGNITPNNTGVTKIEFAKWNPNGSINATGRNVTLGRGLTMGGTKRALYGTNSTSAVNQILKVESGNFSTFTHYEDDPSSITKQWIYFGNDYDRARNNNSTLTFSGLFMVGDGRDLGLSSTEEMCRVFSISGSFMTGIEISTGAANYSYYLGIKSNHNNGHRYFEVQGGEWYANIAGGMGENHSASSPAFTFRMKGGIIRGSIYGAGAFAPAGGERRYIITGGNIGGWVAAGCNGIGSNTSQDNNGATNGDSYVYVGGNAKIGYQNRTINDVAGGNVFGAGRGAPVTTYNVGTINNSNIVVADKAEIENNVYGGGNYGFSLDEANIYVLGGTVDGRVFGGANMTKGYSPSIVMNGGTVKDGVYGGCNTEGTINNNVTMQINGGQVGTSSKSANIHGGGYGQATRVSGNVEVTLGTEKQATGGVTVYGDVYGGSALGYVNGTTANDTYHTYVTLNKGTINGSLYGGGLGSNDAANVYGPVKVEVHGGSVKKTSAAGSGGVYGANNINGAPQRSVTVDIYGTDPAPAEGQYALYAVYGGGNQANYLYGKGYPTVTVHNCDNSIEYVYGGGNAAAVAATDVTIWGGDVIGNVFGGGNGESGTAADVNGNVDLKIYGGTILNVFGGSNSKGEIEGDVNVKVNSQGEGEKAPCRMIIGNVYGGGNEANGNAGTLTIGCTGTLVEGNEGHLAHPENIGKTLEGIGAVYGGANNADIGKSDARSDITLNINSGMVANVFGGNNTGGNIYGNITVNVNKNAETCGWYVGNVYGAGNLAAYTGSPVVNIQNGTVSGNVFGGGLGETAIVTGNPQVTIGDAVTEHTAIVGGDVYGGGDAANVVGTPVVNIVNKCNTTIGNVYGGGNAADVNGTDVNIDGGTITSMVFGGGHGDNSAEISANVNGNVNLDITGGTINKVFGGSNSMGNITGSIALNIQKVDGHCDMRIAEVYGGGNEADGNAGSLTIGCTGALVEGDNGHVAHPEKIGKELEGIGAVYGGANNANIGNDVTLNINSGMVAKVFGGNNTGGTVNGNVTVNVNKNANACGWYVGKVHGGGYGKETNVAKDVTVNIENGTIYGDVYGGSALGKVNTDTDNTTTVNLTGGLIKGDAYGGGLGDSTAEADVNGNVTVTLNGTAFELTTIKDDKGNTIPTSGRIFGCNNINGSPKGTVLVKVLNTVAKNSDGTTKAKPTKGSGIYELQAVYGGGNLAAYNPTNPKANGQFTSYTYRGNATPHDNIAKPVQVVIDGCNETSIEYVYGGGNAAATPATDVTILGSYEIGNVFGGGNGKDRYTLDGGITWYDNEGADVGINTQGKYGTGNAMTSVLGGTVNNIYGGSNTKGNVVGEATAYLDKASDCSLVVNSIYGGGNEAYMDGKPNIVLGCIDYLKEVYGGSRNADVGSDINITITSGHFDRVFGGNNLGGAIKGSITLNIEETGCNPITIGEVYGGGNKAAYSVYGYETNGKPKETGEKLYSDPVVNLRSFTSIGRVFGGGLGEDAVMVGSPTVNINEVKGENADNTEWTYLGKTINYDDETSVTLPSHSAGAIGAIGTVFGGGNAAKVIGDTHVNIGTLESVIFVTPETDTEANRTHKVEGADIRENVYGGGNKADVTGKTNVTIGK